MASPLRSGSAPRCLACIRRYAFNGGDDALAPTTALRQQIRGRRKMANNSATVTVRLLKDVEGYGQRGALLPLPRGQMRNEWFPRGIADYVLPPEVKKLRLSNVPIQRDHFFARKEKVIKVPSTGNAEGEMSKDQITSASKFAKKVDVGRLPPHRMVALLEAFIGPRLDFYRQPIAEEKVEEVAEEKAPEPPKKREHFGSGAGADLLAARMEKPTSPKKEDSKAQAIYGSVSPLDVVQALRAALAFDDDAKRVVLSEQDVQFVDLPEMEGEAAKVVKHVGDFEVEITIRGSDTPVRRTVRVIPQEP